MPDNEDARRRSSMRAQGPVAAGSETSPEAKGANGSSGDDDERKNRSNGLTNAVEAIKAPKKPVRFGLKVLAFALVLYFLVLPLVPDFRDALDRIREVQSQWLIAGVTLQIAALFCYSLMTRAALGEAGSHLSAMRLFRIQMSTKALSHVVPGGSAAGSALGYRLLTLSNVTGPNAGFALATAGLGSAVVLNLIFWSALLISIPIRGVNPLYATAALAGVVIIMVAGFLVVGLLQGHERAELVLRWVARRLRFDEHRAAEVLAQIGHRLEDLVRDREILKWVVIWAATNWLLDAASLWVFVRAFGQTLDPDALLVAFGLANVMAVIPITPGGLGIVEGVYVPTLTGFGLRRGVASLSVASYRIVQFLFPIALGGILYLSLRVGPWRIERREELRRLRDLATSDETSETAIDFALRLRDGVDDTGETFASDWTDDDTSGTGSPAEPDDGAGADRDDEAGAGSA